MSTNYQPPAFESDSHKSQKSNKSKSSIPSDQGNAFHKPPSSEKTNGSKKTNKSNKSQGDSKKENQKQAEQQAQDEARRQDEEQREAEEELQHQLAKHAQQLADDEARRLEQQKQQQQPQQEKADDEARRLEQQLQQQRQQQQNTSTSQPSLHNLNINHPDDQIADIVPIDMIFLRLRPETNTIDEALLTLPLDSIQRLDSSRTERFDFSRRSKTGHRDIGVLQTLCRMKGLPVTPGYKKVLGAKEGEEQWEPAEGGLDTLREVLIGQLRRWQDLERWEPKPIQIKCYLRYFRPGDPEDGASTRMHAEIVRKLQEGVGDLKDVTDRTWERWVSDGPPGELRNFRKFGYREEGEDLECRAPGEWETMYWIEGALPRDSRFYTEMKGRKTQADEGDWKGLVSRRVPSPPRFMDPVTGRNGKPRKKPARDSGVGMGDDEKGEEEDEEARREKARWQRAQDEHARKQRERRKRQKEAAAAAQPQPQDETLTADGTAQKKDLEYWANQKKLREAAKRDEEEEGVRREEARRGQIPDEIPAELLGDEAIPEVQAEILRIAQAEAQERKEKAEAARREEGRTGKRSSPTAEEEEGQEGPQKKPKLADENRQSEAEERKEENGEEKAEPRVLTPKEKALEEKRKRAEEIRRRMAEGEIRNQELTQEEKGRKAKGEAAKQKADEVFGDLDNIGSEGSGEGDQICE